MTKKGNLLWPDMPSLRSRLNSHHTFYHFINKDPTFRFGASKSSDGKREKRRAYRKAKIKARDYHLKQALRYYRKSLLHYGLYKASEERLDRWLRAKPSFRNLDDREFVGWQARTYTKWAYECAFVSACFETLSQHNPKLHSAAGRLITKLERVMSPEDIVEAKRGGEKFYKRWLSYLDRDYSAKEVYKEPFKD